MSIYHLNDKGDPGRCKAEVGNCPFGSPADHYITKEDAAKAYELKQSGSFEIEEEKALAQHQVAVADAKLLHHALRMTDLSNAERTEIEVKTDAIAIVRAAQIEKLSERLSA